MEKSREHLLFNHFTWESVSTIDYKQGDIGSTTFYNVTRQNIISSKDGVDFEVRYFECGPEGFSTLEKHQHAHIVLIARGCGKVIIGNNIYDASPFDCLIISEGMPHQLINMTDEPFGFFCTVNSRRDKFKLLTKEETEQLKKNSEIERFIKIPERYFE